MLLLYVQTKNFIYGKTTMERFGRVGGDTDRETRIINSGIRDDTQIFKQSISRVSSFQNPRLVGSVSMEMFAEDEPDGYERLISAHDQDQAQSSRVHGQESADILTFEQIADRRREFKQRNKKLARQAQDKSTCWAMCS